MMPQKKNPDVFELVRGKSARSVGNVVAMLALMKGLASGYNRDQQEDRLPLLEAAPLALGCVRVVELALPHVTFDRERGARALDEGFTQATDLAEALVRLGVPFREAYRAVGKLVALAVDEGIALRAVSVARAQTVHPLLDAHTLEALDPRTAVAAKESAGGTGPLAVEGQIEWLRARSAELGALAGFEKSGHYFFNPPIGRGYDDGIVAAIAVLEMLDRAGDKKMSALVDGLPRTWGTPTMAPYCPDDKKYAVVDALTAAYEDLKARGETILGQKIARIITVNGVRVVLEDGTWGLVRASSNKPSLVVVAESPVSEANMRAMFGDIDARLSQHPEVGEYDQKI